MKWNNMLKITFSFGVNQFDNFVLSTHEKHALFVDILAVYA